MFDEYEARILLSFDTAREFFKTHKRPRTSKDWDMIDIALCDYRDSFTGDLVTAVVDELLRECEHAKARQSLDLQGVKKAMYGEGGIWHG
jgi:hypothetical protein